MQVESKSVTLRGWDAVMGMAGVLFSWVCTALLISLPIVWMVNHVFAAGAIRTVFGCDRIRYCTRVKFTFPNTLKGKI